MFLFFWIILFFVWFFTIVAGKNHCRIQVCGGYRLVTEVATSVTVSLCGAVVFIVDITIVPFFDCVRCVVDAVHVLSEYYGSFVIADLLRWFEVSHTLTVVGHFWFLLFVGVTFALIVFAFSPTCSFTFAFRIAELPFSFLTSFSFVVELS